MIKNDADRVKLPNRRLRKRYLVHIVRMREDVPQLTKAEVFLPPRPFSAMRQEGVGFSFSGTSFKEERRFLCNKNEEKVPVASDFAIWY